MHRAEIAEAYDPVKLLPCRLIAFGGGKVISCGKCVACVDTYAYARFVFDEIDDGAYLLKRIAEIGALSGSRLNDCPDTLSAVKGNVYRLGNRSDACISIDEIEVRARMKIEHRQAELAAAPELIEESLTRACEFISIRRTEVNQIAVVRKDMLRSIPQSRASLLEQSGFLV